MEFQAKIESIQLETDSSYQKIIFNNLIIDENEPEVLNDLYQAMQQQRYMKIIIEE